MNKEIILSLLVFTLALSLAMAPARAAITCTGTDSTKSIVVGETGDITVSCSGITSGSVEVNAQYSSNCLELKDTLPTLTSESPSAQITFEATSMSCQYDSSDRTVTWSFTKPGESISSQNTLVTITSPLSVTATFKNAPYAATAGNTVTVILEISTGATVDITDVDVDMTSTHASLRGSNKISNWDDNTIYSSGSQKTIQKSWSFAAPSAGSYTIAAIITTQNAGGDQESTILSVSAAGSPGGSPGGGPVGAPADEEDEEGEKETRNPSLVPGVGLRDNERLQAAIEKVLGIANMSDQARENLIRLSQSISSSINMTREISVVSGTSKLTTKIKYTGDEKVSNFMLFDSVPKTFAASASNMTVTAPGATYEIAEQDPSFIFLYPELTFGQEVTISYEVSEEVDTSVIDGFSGEVYAQGLQEFACDVGQRRCTENDLEQCNSDRSGWELVEVCEYGCVSGACNPAPSSDFWSMMQLLIVIVVIVIVVAAVLITKKRKKGPGKMKFKSNTPSGTPSSPESESISRF